MSEIIWPETGMTARDEMRVSAFGVLRCPSCGGLAAEIFGAHSLVFVFEPCEGEPLRVRAECRDGEPVETADYDEIVAIANIAVADDFQRRETLAWRRLGWPV